jgi:hypothetical protein
MWLRVNGHHQAPRERADGAQEALRFAVRRHQRREEQEGPHRDEHDEHAVPVDPRPIELDGNGEIGEQQDAAVDAPRRDQREVFLQREIGDEAEEDDGDGAVQEHREREGADHPPPGAHAVLQLAILA